MNRRILILAIVMTTAALIALFIPASIALQSAHRRAQQIELQNEAFNAGYQFETSNNLAGLAEHRFAIYGADERLIQGDGPEIADAAVLAALGGSSLVLHEGANMVAAVPLTQHRVLRASETAEESDLRASRSVIKLGVVALAMIAFSTVAAMGLSRRMNRPLAALATSARRLGGGDFSARAAPSGLVEIDDVAAALNSTAARLAHLVSRERRLTSETSHQLRTPLAGMRVAIEAEVHAPRLDRSALMDDLLSAIDRMDAAISDLIALSRDTDPTGLVVDASDFVRRASQRWEQPFRAAVRTLASDISTDLATTANMRTTARPAAIDTVLDVLLDNALRHGSGTTSITLESHSGSPMIRVKDEGHFVGDDTIDPFHAGPPPGDQHGFGLGIAYALTDAEGGRIRLAKRDPTTFELILPTPIGSLSE
jgi:signal transduction histidine kinase